MNALISNRTSLLLAYGLPALIIVVAVSIASTSLITAHPELAVGITYDLTLTAPLIYLFFIRKTKIPKMTVMPVFVGGIILASFLLPAGERFHLDLVKFWILPVIEVFVLGYIGFTVYKTVKTYRAVKSESTDILKILRETCRKTLGLPVLADAAAFELAVLYYGFLKWKKPLPAENAYTCHRTSGKIALYGAVIFILTIETIVVHILIAMWSELAAWILTLTSAYVILQLFAHLKALGQRPIEITEDRIFIRYGLFEGVEIERENIEDIEFSSVKTDRDKPFKQAALLGELEHFNMKIRLKNAAEFTGLYGMKSKFQTLLLFVDEKEKFKRLIENQ
jgi:hypothetical protein